MIGTRTCALTGLTAAAVLACAAPAAATPGQGVEAQVLAQWTAPGAAGDTFTLRRIDFAADGTTGWHYHEGPVYAVVAQGTLERTMSDCAVVTSQTGEIVAEETGPDHVHVGNNPGADPLTLFVLYVSAPGAPLASDAAALDCP